jgi:hypothetical protein
MLDKVPFIVIKFLPVFDILSQVDLFSRPEACHLIFVHFPNVIILYRKNHKSIGVFFQQWFRNRALRLSIVAVLRLQVIISIIHIVLLHLRELAILLLLLLGNLRGTVVLLLLIVLLLRVTTLLEKVNLLGLRVLR